jgi:hypothetical protein
MKRGDVTVLSGKLRVSYWLLTEEESVSGVDIDLIRKL